MIPHPIVYLSYVPGSSDSNALCGWYDIPKFPQAEAPSLLVSFAFAERFDKHRDETAHRSWFVDSGAFSAEQSAADISIDNYIPWALHLREIDKTVDAFAALDVIGDAAASRRNCDLMWAAGIEAIPTFHVGSDLADLRAIARDFPRIALGGMVGMPANYKLEWATACFDAVWPKKIHGFGVGSEKQILALPWHTVDTTRWSRGARFGMWDHLGGGRIVGRDGDRRPDLTGEIRHYLALEDRARHRWAKEMKELEG